MIRVGAATEVELKEKKHRVEDALSATRAAVEEGIVAGGGVTLMNAVSALTDVSLENEDAQRGVDVLEKSLEIPMRKIAANAGQDGSVIISNVRRAQEEKKSSSIGYNVISENYVDMISEGIIDPAKVTRGALENAASIAAMILTTEALVTEKPEKDAPPMPPAPDMGGMGGMM